VAAKEIAVKKYVVKLNAAEREQLGSLIHTGKHPAQKLMKARILLTSTGRGLLVAPNRPVQSVWLPKRHRRSSQGVGIFCDGGAQPPVQES
jgi:hypothetical protein